MDSKRKANGAAAPAETDDRASKRRKLASEFNLSKGETRESTTAYGLSFLDQIRRTSDKSGRLVATYFEKLLPREGNEEYYERTRLPISLESIEEKLENGEFKSLAEVESYFKRMIVNAKEFYPRSSSTFDDAERLRKALSNYMTKNNPAYQNRSYQALPTPLPPENPDDEEDEDDAEDNEDGEDEAEEEEPEEQDDEAEEEEEPSSKRRSIILKRRGSSRPTRSSIAKEEESPEPAANPARPDHQYEDVPYKGLNLQQGQEKLVEEMLRHQEPEYDDAYFEPFVNLPPRALKDYYKVIKDPLSLKKLQKIVRGIHGRNDVPGVSEFKTWSAFEEKAKLLWTNAYYYNEEGSEIYSLAQELEAFFYKQLKEAQAAVPEPSQPKIKLKVNEQPSGKKITIHVGGRGGSSDSPAPQKTNEANGQVNGTSGTGTPALPQLDKTRSVSASVPSPSPSTAALLKAEEGAAGSPAVTPRPPSAASGQAAGGAPIPAVQSQPAPPNPISSYMEPKRLRGPGKGVDDALISSVRIQLHPSFQVENSTVASVLPNPTELQQSATLSLPPALNRIFIIVALPDHLKNRQYSLWTVINRQPIKPCVQMVPGQQSHERAFEAVLHHGVNVIESHLIAAVPRSERLPGGPEAELEVFTILANVLRN